MWTKTNNLFFLYFFTFTHLMKHENIFIHWLQVMGVNIHFTHIKLGHMIPNIYDDVLIIKIATLVGKYYSNLSKQKKQSHDSVYNYKS